MPPSRESSAAEWTELAKEPASLTGPSSLRPIDRVSRTEGAGAKAAGLERISRVGLRVPRWFALGLGAFDAFVREGALELLIEMVDRGTLSPGELVEAVQRQVLPADLRQQIERGLPTLSGRRYAVRSSCLHEDLAHASFAGVYESFINVPPEGIEQAVIRCYVSLYSPRSIAYARRQNLPLAELRMGVIIQEVVDASVSGTMFSCDPRSGFRGVTLVEAVRGFGEGLVSGRITPDRWTVLNAKGTIIGRALGGDPQSVQADPAGGLVLSTREPGTAARACLTDDEVSALVAGAAALEAQLGCPVDVEWSRSTNGVLHFLQSRPAIVDASTDLVSHRVVDGQGGEPVLRGTPISSKAVTGRARLCETPQPLAPGDILVVRRLDPEWLPYITAAAGVIVEGGGHTSHMAILLREHSVPTAYGATGAMTVLAAGEELTLVCSADEASVWRGHLTLERVTTDPSSVRRPTTKVHVVTSTTANLDQHFRLPLNGIGLVRIEYLIATAVNVHPLAIAAFDDGSLDDAQSREAIAARCEQFPSASAWFVDALAGAIAALACRCPVGGIVNVRLPDVISEDGEKLVGEDAVCQALREDNPMLGWRGTSRLIDPSTRRALKLVCAALRRVVEDYGFTNVNLLVPFCRTPKEGKAIRDLLREHGPRGARVGMMVEIPSNVMLARAFAEIFDFFLVGPMDLTQLTYGADRRSPKVGHYCGEVEAVKEMVKALLRALSGCRHDIFIGGWPLFQFLEEYRPLLGENRLHLVELPDQLVELFANLNALEERMRNQ
jgi:pyruvate,water dikinase